MPNPPPPLTDLLMLGLRGSAPGDPILESDLDACADAGVKAVILFDTDLPTLRALEQQGVPTDEARARATRNIISPEQTRALAAHIRARLGDDCLIAVDHEGGRVARLAPERGFSPAPTAAAFAQLDDRAQRDAAQRLARECASVRIDINFAPCVDLALNPDNPIIARLERAFSADPDVVTRCAAHVINAHHAAGVAPCIKHYPGHGSSAHDTHKGAVDITRTHQHAESEPFRRLINQYAPPSPPLLVMTGHLIDRRTDPDNPASLSRAHTTDNLRTALNFQGVIVTDSLDMGAITDRYSPEEACIRALNAGADLLLHALNSETHPNDHPAPALAEALRRAHHDGALDTTSTKRALARLNTLRTWTRTHTP